MRLGLSYLFTVHIPIYEIGNTNILSHFLTLLCWGDKISSQTVKQKYEIKQKWNSESLQKPVLLGNGRCASGPRSFSQGRGQTSDTFSHPVPSWVPPRSKEFGSRTYKKAPH